VPNSYETLTVEKQGPVDWLTLNRPERLNTLNETMVDELLHYFHHVAADASVRIVVIKGTGRAFCAGLDLGERPTGTITDSGAGLAAQRRISEIVMRMRRAPQAIVSLVHGPACGGGFAIALASDIRIAGESARMNAAFIRLGLSACDIGVSYFLPRLVGASLASELMFTGDFIGAERAFAAGLVSRVVPDAELAEAVRPLLKSMLTTSPLGLRLTKECLRMSIDAPSLESAIAMEDRNQILCALGEDFAEGTAAFLEKRPPRYSEMEDRQ
jgi:enoyl-CoA hydratase/carnithine racemase